MTVLQFRRQKVYEPDPRNGEVYTTSWYQHFYDAAGRETEVFAGFVVVHMSWSGDSASILDGFDSLGDADASALQVARKYNAVLLS